MALASAYVMLAGGPSLDIGDSTRSGGSSLKSADAIGLEYEGIPSFGKVGKLEPPDIGIGSMLELVKVAAETGT